MDGVLEFEVDGLVVEEFLGGSWGWEFDGVEDEGPALGGLVLVGEGWHFYGSCFEGLALEGGGGVRGGCGVQGLGFCEFFSRRVYFDSEIVWVLVLGGVPGVKGDSIPGVLGEGRSHFLFTLLVFGEGVDFDRLEERVSNIHIGWIIYIITDTNNVG